MENVKELKKLVGFLRKNGIIHYKSGDFELSITPSYLFTPKHKTKESQKDDFSGLQTPELLFWSTPDMAEQQ